ncbi:CDK5 regulatory subunit-associated protein 2 [Ananas comosus]|uniref:CDK5 regulatory subunit-associated protein 2 n=1 Tax=Ananas comosus TaxID=4615 RepID=A0A199VCV5_ANACO|nr:CDK5 regulatory subunit-associated protein 2 [Ananas comosus]OAY74610.1 hypothetical protein ACMD2_02347 [Ananas comosus]
MGGSPKSSSPSSDRRQWQRIFRALVEMLRSQQSQIETLVGDREFLERYVHAQSDRWSSRVRLLEYRLAQMKVEEAKGRQFQEAKLELLVGMKQREALCFKKQSELAESDLDDYQTCVEVLTAEISDLKENLKHAEAEADKELDFSGTDQSTQALRGEIRKLKQAYKTLSSRKDVEVSALLAEKDFVWNQFKKMESDYTSLLKSKRLEAEQANEAAEKLQHNLTQLRASANEKDDIIAKLEEEKARLESDLRKHSREVELAEEKTEVLKRDMEELQSLANEKDETIRKLKNEIDLVKGTSRRSRFSNDLGSRRKTRNEARTPSMNLSRGDIGKRILRSAKGDISRKRKFVRGESSGSRASSSVDGLRRCSGRLHGKASSPLVSPMLFSSSFKVPKLKSLSQHHHSAAA